MARRKKHTHHEEEHENEERWLVSFADMMTLLFCVFMILFAISSVNTSKFEALQKSMKDAFSGAVLDGGTSMMSAGAEASDNDTPSPEPPLPALPSRTRGAVRLLDIGSVTAAGRTGAGAPRADVGASPAPLGANGTDGTPASRRRCVSASSDVADEDGWAITVWGALIRVRSSSGVSGPAGDPWTWLTSVV